MQKIIWASPALRQVCGAICINIRPLLQSLSPSFVLYQPKYMNVLFLLHQQIFYAKSLKPVRNTCKLFPIFRETIGSTFTFFENVVWNNFCTNLHKTNSFQPSLKKRHIFNNVWEKFETLTFLYELFPDTLSTYSKKTDIVWIYSLFQWMNFDVYRV